MLRKPLVLDDAGDMQRLQPGDLIDLTNVQDAASATHVDQQLAIVNTNLIAVQTTANSAATAADLLTEVTNRIQEDALLVPKTTTVNGKALTSDINLNSADIGSVDIASIGIPGGIVPLGADGKVAMSYMNDSLLGAMIYQGVWDASLNIPALVAGTGSKGHYYKVNVAGSSLIDGNDVWGLGDIIVFDGLVWDKIEGSATDVTSVFGRVGAVVLMSSDVVDALLPGAIPNAALANTAVADLSGINTGDQTIVMSGDIVGSGTGAIVTALSQTGIVPGTYSVLTIDDKGRAIAGDNVIPNTLKMFNADITVLVAGTPVYANVSDSVKQAIATTKLTSTVIGLVNSDIVPGAQGDIKESNELVLDTAQWDLITGGSGGLVFGATYYLS
ncbi:MAG: hypothetical protein ACD_84C00006G0003, partial [uncultured bacterium]